MFRFLKNLSTPQFFKKIIQEFLGLDPNLFLPGFCLAVSI